MGHFWRENWLTTIIGFLFMVVVSLSSYIYTNDREADDKRFEALIEMIKSEKEDNDIAYSKLDMKVEAKLDMMVFNSHLDRENRRWEEYREDRQELRYYIKEIFKATK